MDTTSIEVITESPNQEFLTLDEAAKILRVNSTTIGRRVKRGELSAIHIGRRVVIRRVDFMKFIIANLNGSI